MNDATLRLPSCLFYQGLPESPRSAPELNTLAAEGITTGTDLDQTVSAIHTYGAQKVAVQNESNDFVVNGNFPKLLNVLYNNLQDLSSTMPVDPKDDEMYMRATLMELCNKWFQIDFYDMDRPRAWIATQSLHDE